MTKKVSSWTLKLQKNKKDSIFTMRILSGIKSKAKRLFISSSTKEKIENGENPVEELHLKSNPVAVIDSGFAYMGSNFVTGSKEESFFDSKAWLDSDCEDDFFSVNGEFTPSRGSTPNYPLSAPRTPQWNKSSSLPQFPDTKSETSPTDRKKKLFDLLQEPFQSEHVDNEKNAPTNGKLDAFGFKNGLPPISYSEFDSEATPGIDLSHKKERAGKIKSCCFPSLMPNRSFNDGRKQIVRPAQ